MGETSYEKAKKKQQENENMALEAEIKFLQAKVGFLQQEILFYKQKCKNQNFSIMKRIDSICLSFKDFCEAELEEQLKKNRELFEKLESSK